VTEPSWVEERVALVVHARLLALYGGAPGLRDEGLLQSALARPQQIFSYGESPNLIELAAAYIAGIVRNHPFVDGNKRTGFLVGVLFLETNGVRFTAPEEDATRAILDLAAGVLDEASFTAWLRSHVKRSRRKRWRPLFT
jgi:death on curing protein